MIRTDSIVPYPPRSPDPQQENEQRDKNVREIQLQAPGLDDAEAVRDSVEALDDGIVQVFLKDRLNVSLKMHALGKVARLFKQFGLQLHSRPVDRAEDLLDRLGESGRRVLHPRFQ